MKQKILGIIGGMGPSHIGFIVKSRETKKAREFLDEIIKHVKDKDVNVNTIILGCTELPIIIEEINGINILNPTQLLVDAILREVNKSN